MTMPRILIVGAGAIGGYFGARMIQNGSDVTFLVRPRRAAQLAADGLAIRSPRGDVTIPAPQTVTADALAAPFDAVILSCKAFDLPGAMDALAPAMGPQTRLLPLLNGMAHLQALSARFGEAAILGGVAQISTTLETDGSIRQFGDMQAILLGERGGPASAVTQALAVAIAPAGGRMSADIVQEMWEKWVFITTLAGATCLMRTTIGDIAAADADRRPARPARRVRRHRRRVPASRPAPPPWSAPARWSPRRRVPRSPPACCATSRAASRSRWSTWSATC